MAAKNFCLPSALLKVSQISLLLGIRVPSKDVDSEQCKGDSRWRCTVLTAAQFRDMHRLQGLHSRAYLAIPALLVEDEAEPVRSVPVLLGEHERVERRLHRVLLSPESEAARQAELKD